MNAEAEAAAARIRATRDPEELAQVLAQLAVRPQTRSAEHDTLLSILDILTRLEATQYQKGVRKMKRRQAR